MIEKHHPLTQPERHILPDLTNYMKVTDSLKTKANFQSAKTNSKSQNRFIAWLCYLLLALLLALGGKSIWAQIEDIKDEADSDLSGITTLMTAVTNRDIETIKYYIKSVSSEVNKKNYGGATALHLACRDGNFEIASILIDGGAEVNVADKEGWTPLMRASLAANPEIVDLLLSKGANVEDVNNYGEIAILHATSSGCGKCVVSMVRKMQIGKVIDSEEIRNQMVEAYEIARQSENTQAQEAISDFNNQLLKFTPFVTESKNKTSENISAEESTKNSSQDTTETLLGGDSKSEQSQIYEVENPKGSVLRNLAKHKIPKRFKLLSDSKKPAASKKAAYRALRSNSVKSQDKVLTAQDDETEDSISDDEFARASEDIKSSIGSSDKEFLIDSFDVADPNLLNHSTKESSDGEPQKKYKIISEIPLSLDDQINNNKALNGKTREIARAVNRAEDEILLNDYYDSRNVVDLSANSYSPKNDHVKRIFVYTTETSDANYGKDLSKQNIPILKKYKFLAKKNRAANAKLPSAANNGTKNLVNAPPADIKVGEIKDGNSPKLPPPTLEQPAVPNQLKKQGKQPELPSQQPISKNPINNVIKDASIMPENNLNNLNEKPSETIKMLDAKKYGGE